jgi:plastocyanin
MRRTASSLPLLLTALLCACIALPQGLQVFRLFFELDQALAAGEQVEASSTVYPAGLGVKKSFVQIYGRLTPPGGSALPDRIEVEVLLTRLSNQSVYYRYRQTLPVAADGSFSRTARFKRDIAAGSMQTVLVRPLGAGVARGTDIAVCVEVAKRQSELSPGVACGAAPPGGGGDVTVVQVRDNSFSPQSVQVEPGDTVRWVRTGAAPNHTVTASGNAFDSGLTLQAQGATFERTFGPADDNKTFEYYCASHRTCCAMQGSVRVGSNAPAPQPGY